MAKKQRSLMVWRPRLGARVWILHRPADELTYTLSSGVVTGFPGGDMLDVRLNDDDKTVLLLSQEYIAPATAAGYARLRRVWLRLRLRRLEHDLREIWTHLEEDGSLDYAQVKVAAR